MAGLLAASCDDSFEPIDRSGPAFSVFGYLDASADTQWIRINSLRRATLVESPEPSGVAVSVEHLGTGKTIALRDSAIRYEDMMGSGSLYAHNFWTAERLEPGASYRLRAESRDGEVAESVVRIPPDYHLEVWVLQPMASQSPSARSKYLRVEGVKELPFIFWYSSHDETCLTARACRSIQAMSPGGDSVARMYGSGGARAAETVASGAEWPFGLDFSVWRLVPDTTGSSIKGAFGFVGGVLSRSTWIEDCALPYPSSPDTYCKLRYDSTTATLRGSVASACGVSAERLSIQLRELEPPAGEQPRTRFGALDSLNNYDIGAVRSGRHELSITSQGFIPQFDTLQFAQGEKSHHLAILEPVGECPK